MSAKWESREKIRAPLVSIIISNYNYQKYIEQAIESSFEQNYPNIEVIVVDDASTDDSVAVAKKALANCANGQVISRLVNGGQGRALLDGYRQSSGEFINFLDADDVLCPDFVGAHLYTHFALPWQVAFTSSRLVHIGPSGRLISGSSGSISRKFASAEGEGNVELAPIRIEPHLDRLLNEAAADIRRCVYLPPTNVGYHWSSCSGILFKRAAIDQIAYDKLIANVHIGVDFYFTLSHLFNGSAIIDARLGGYRIHGTNSYSRSPHLDGVSHTRINDAEHFVEILVEFARCITGPKLEHCRNLLSLDMYCGLLKSVQEYAGHFTDQDANSTLIGQEIIANLAHLFRVLGRENTIRLLTSYLGVTNEELSRITAINWIQECE